MAMPYLCPGARFTFEQRPAEVSGTIWFREDGDTWASHRVHGLDSEFWLDVEDGELSAWTPRRDLAGVQPGQRRLEVDGMSFRLSESGRASYEAQGDTATRDRGECEYFDYTGPGGAMLSFECFDSGVWEASLGREIDDSELGTSA